MSLCSSVIVNILIFEKETLLAAELYIANLKNYIASHTAHNDNTATHDLCAKQDAKSES